jgi:hypothetical protein
VVVGNRVPGGKAKRRRKGVSVSGKFRRRNFGGDDRKAVRGRALPQQRQFAKRQAVEDQHCGARARGNRVPPSGQSIGGAGQRRAELAPQVPPGASQPRVQRSESFIPDSRRGGRQTGTGHPASVGRVPGDQGPGIGRRCPLQIVQQRKGQRRGHVGPSARSSERP